MSDSLVIKLRPGLSRDLRSTDDTLLFAWRSPLAPDPDPDLGRAFVRHYRAIRESLEGFTGPGLLIVVIGPAGFEASAALAEKDDSINAVTIGRHDSASLFLAGDPTLSLRQGAVLLYPQAEGRGVRFRVLDLRATRPFEDQRGRRFEALEAEGPVFLRASGYSLFMFPRGKDAPSWSGTPESVWAALSDVTYLEEAGLPDRPAQGELAPDLEGTLILSLPGPCLDHESLVLGGEPPHGQLVVRSQEGEMRLALGRAAARRGVLLGRAERCDGSSTGVLAHRAFSRVHALVIEIAGKLYAVDAGSRNGLWRGTDRVRTAPLGSGRSASLAGHMATLEWTYSN